MPASSATDIALRAKRLDEVVRRFVGRHPNAIVLDLGAGLDGRIFRIDRRPPSTGTTSTSRLSSPPVACSCRTIPTSTASARTWPIRTGWTRYPTDRPAVVVADGLIAFLAQDVVVALLNRLSAHLAGGELAFNAYTRFHVWAVKRYRGTRSIADAVVEPRLRRPAGSRALEPPLEAGGGGTPHASARGCPVPAGPPTGHPVSGAQHGTVPSGHGDPALPVPTGPRHAMRCCWSRCCPWSSSSRCGDGFSHGRRPWRPGSDTAPTAAGDGDAASGSAHAGVPDSARTHRRWHELR